MNEEMKDQVMDTVVDTATDAVTTAINTVKESFEPEVIYEEVMVENPANAGFIVLGAGIAALVMAGVKLGTGWYKKRKEKKQLDEMKTEASQMTEDELAGYMRDAVIIEDAVVKTEEKAETEAPSEKKESEVKKEKK